MTSTMRWIGMLALPTWASLATCQTNVLLGLHHSGIAGPIAYDSVRQRTVMVVGSLAGLDSTFEWDGTRWTLRRSAVRPPVRDSFALAFDSQRGRLVLHGGRHASFGPVGTWEFDGHRWQQVTMAVAPAERHDHAMSFDSGRGCTVMFGGVPGSGILGDTWEYDGSTWVQRTPNTSPPPCALHAMTYDPVRARTVLFRSSPPALWEWDGTNWSNVTPPNLNASNTVAGATYDAANTRVLLKDHAQIWSWDGTALQQLAFASQPPSANIAWEAHTGRLLVAAGGATWALVGNTFHLVASQPNAYGRRLVFDSVRQRAILYSHWHIDSWSSTTWYWGVTFEWDGARWQSVASGPLRGDPCVVFDAAHGVMLVHGGGSYTGVSDETWTWDGTTWTDVSGAVRPPGWSHSCMAPDGARQNVVLYTPNAETWTWDGLAWTLRAPTVNPGPRSGACLVEDRWRQRLVLFGGGLANPATAQETWEWDGTNWLLRSPLHSPPSRRNATAFFDDARGVVVVHAGIGTNGGLADGWQWNGNDWTPNARALPADGQAMVAEYLPQTDQVLTVHGTAAWRPTHAIEGPLVAAGTAAIGTGCGGVVAPPLLLANTPYFLNPAFTVEFTRITANSPAFLGFSFQQGNLAIGCGCTVYLADPIGLIALAGTPAGNARFELAVPAAGWLRGLELVVQGLVLDPVGACAPIALTGAVSLRFGD